jgi:hypothetical protein
MLTTQYACPYGRLCGSPVFAGLQAGDDFIAGSLHSGALVAAVTPSAGAGAPEPCAAAGAGGESVASDLPGSAGACAPAPDAGVAESAADEVSVCVWQPAINNTATIVNVLPFVLLFIRLYMIAPRVLTVRADGHRPALQRKQSTFRRRGAFVDTRGSVAPAGARPRTFCSSHGL